MYTYLPYVEVSYGYLLVCVYVSLVKMNFVVSGDIKW